MSDFRVLDPRASCKKYRPNYGCVSYPQVTLSIVPWKSAARDSGDFAVMADMEASLVIQEQMKSTLYNMTVPVTTRPMADGEEQGRDYFFVAVQDFEEVGPRISDQMRMAILRELLI